MRYPNKESIRKAAIKIEVLNQLEAIQPSTRRQIGFLTNRSAATRYYLNRMSQITKEINRLLKHPTTELTLGGLKEKFQELYNENIAHNIHCYSTKGGEIWTREVMGGAQSGGYRCGGYPEYEDQASALTYRFHAKYANSRKAQATLKDFWGVDPVSTKPIVLMTSEEIITYGGISTDDEDGLLVTRIKEQNTDTTNQNTVTTNPMF